MDQIMYVLLFIAVPLAFVFGLRFPLGKLLVKTALILYGGYFIIYVVLVASSFYSMYNRSQVFPIKFDSTDPQMVLSISTIGGAIVFLFPSVGLYVIGSIIKYIYLFFKRQWVH